MYDVDLDIEVVDGTHYRKCINLYANTPTCVSLFKLENKRKSTNYRLVPYWERDVVVVDKMVECGLFEFIDFTWFPKHLDVIAVYPKFRIAMDDFIEIVYAKLSIGFKILDKYDVVPEKIVTPLGVVNLLS